MRFPLRTIKSKLLLVLLAFALIPFLFVTALGLRTLKQNIRNDIVQRLLILVDAKSQKLFSYFDTIQGRTIDFSSDGLIRQLTPSIVTRHDSGDIASLHRHLVANKQPLDDTLLRILILDPRGVVIVSTDPSENGRDYSGQSYFQRGRQSISVAELNEATTTSSSPHSFAVSLPLYYPDTTELMAVLVNVFDAVRLEQLLSLSSSASGALGVPLETFEAYMVNRDYKMLVYPREFSGDSPGQMRFGLRVDSLPVRRCLQEGAAVSGELYLNYANEEVLGASLCLPEQGWVILSEITSREAFRPLRLIYVQLAFMVSLLVLSIVLAALLLSRKSTEPLRKMMATLARVREGDLSARIDLRSSDEIGGLAQAFNDVAARLKKLYGSLEKRVQDKTRQLHERMSQIQHEKAKDEAILKSIAEGIVVTDPQGRIVIANDAALSILQWSLDAIAGKPFASVFKLEDQDHLPVPKSSHPLQLALSQLKNVSGTYYYLSKSLPPFPISLIVSPVMIDHEVIGAIMVFRDVTKEKEVERMKNEFVSLVSHQLRTPLSAMKWFSELLLTGDVGRLTPEQREFVGNIDQLNQRMIDLVNALLNISRIESGRIIIDPVPTNLADLVNDVLASLQKRIEEKDLHLVVSINPRLPLIRIDPKLIREVYSNFLTNAVKYTPSGGDISIFISAKDGQIISQISDTGYGIPEKEQGKVFQKFYRGSNVISIETDGNGLGLYLVKAIVESSGGTLWFKSAEGKGTTFWFSFPQKGFRAKKGEISLNS